MNKTSRATEARSHGISIRGTVLIALALVLPVLPFAEAGGGARKEIRYVGKLVSYQRPKEIRFDVERQAHKNLRVSFEAGDVPLVCEDNTFPDVDFPSRTSRFLGPRVFQGQHYERQPNGDFTYYEVKGRLLGNGRAAGYLFYLDEPYDPRGTEERAECSTGGQLYVHWQARRR